MKTPIIRFYSIFLSLIFSFSQFSPVASYIRMYKSVIPEETVTETVIVSDEEVREVYYNDVEILKQYLPGIACWGDSLTQGAGGEGTTYPKTIEALIKENLTEKYNIQDKLNASDESEVDWTKYTLPRTVVVNLGVGGERSSTITARAGTIPFRVKGFTIPEGTEAVQIKLLLNNRQEVSPLLQGDPGVNPVTISGVKGRLTFVWDDDGLRYYFQRLKAGDEVKVESGEIMSTATDGKYTNYINVIMMGGNGGFCSLEELIEQHRSLISRNESNSDRYVIVGYHGKLGAVAQYDNIDEVFTEEFGDHYLSILDYFMTDAFSDAGIEPTEQDLIDIENGVCPSSFLCDGIHFTAKGYELLGSLIYEKMEELGYFDEVKTVLGIE